MLSLLSYSLASTATTQEMYPFQKEVQSKQFNGLLKELRCLVCQNQDLADSNAELALDLKKIVYKKVLEGDSNDKIKDFLILRYGDFVSFYPPLSFKTYLLWFAPLVMLLSALLTAVIIIRRKN